SSAGASSQGSIQTVSIRAATPASCAVARTRRAYGEVLFRYSFMGLLHSGRAQQGEPADKQQGGGPEQGAGEAALVQAERRNDQRPGELPGGKGRGHRCDQPGAPADTA